MNFQVKYNHLTLDLVDVRSFSALVKQTKTGYKYLLKKEFLLFYFDQDEDKIALSNEEDFKTLEQMEVEDPENFVHVLVLEEQEEDICNSDDSFQKLSISVRETVEGYRKLSNSSILDDFKLSNGKSVGLSQTIKKNEERENNEVSLVSNPQITKLREKLVELRLEQSGLQQRMKERKLKEKLQGCAQPKYEYSSLLEELGQLPCVREIMEMEQLMGELAQEEQVEAVHQKYEELRKQVGQLVTQRLEKNSRFMQDSAEHKKKVKKLLQEIERQRITCDNALENIEKEIVAVREEISQLTRVNARMQHKSNILLEHLQEGEFKQEMSGGQRKLKEQKEAKRF